ncbi:Two-component system, sensor histidine kinase, (SppK fragment) (sakacine P production), degenerate [Latilactobacillus sakei subsp. sakei 23K]|uniref:Two-component system, sensor histidine kinase, (SppK) (Sakacine P production), degenerate n=3 Tax=Latilactobacillus sakei TaxID=1599 RepID=Q38Y67_LATSS|nr:Two-component system, sensor histidine kinase, (SppK fragment) (sakacine P production), degenerate [Latilactobacillus sakei subsp. sakei 23K]
MLSIKTYAIRQETEDKIARNQQLQDYLVNIEQQYTELRRFKHDYQNTCRWRVLPKRAISNSLRRIIRSY